MTLTLINITYWFIDYGWLEPLFELVHSLGVNFLKAEKITGAVDFFSLLRNDNQQRLNNKPRYAIRASYN